MAFVTTSQVLANVSGWPLSLTWQPQHFRRVNNLGGMDALTATRLVWPGRLRVIRGAQRYRMAHESVRVSLRHPQTRVRSGFLNAATQAEQDHLLRHEQGHYDIVGLLAREFVRQIMDMSIDVVLVEALIAAGSTRASYQRYAEQQILQPARDAWQQTLTDWRIIDEPDHPQGNHRGLYERQTNHGQNAGGQQQWNQMLQHSKDVGVPLTSVLALYRVDPVHFPPLLP